MADFLSRGSVAALALLASTFVQAQEIAPPPTPNADALATQMRILGGNPRDVAALLTAADLSTRLGDAPAALAFLARAQAVDPSNPRINAGRASAMVLLERPGEALRLFEQAQRAGVAMEPYLLQRGLAYDLTGQPGYAQRDYRQLLARRADDEATRRLALSLGISGQREEAMALLDPLLRRSDRAAWRARACIMAMTGDVAGAQKIAGSMIPGGAGLAPFFARLQALAPADRAFAVHFGEVTPSVARANDARLAPQVAALPSRAPQPVAIAPAPVTVARTPVAAAAERLSRRERQQAEREERRRARSRVQVARREPGSMLPSSGATTRAPAASSPASATPMQRGAPIAGAPVAVAAAPGQTPPVASAPAQVATINPAPLTRTPATTAIEPQQGVTSGPRIATQVATANPNAPVVRPAPSVAPPVASAQPSSTVQSQPSPTQVAAVPTTLPGSGSLIASTNPAPSAPARAPIDPASITSAASNASGVTLPRTAVPWAGTPNTPAAPPPSAIAATPTITPGVIPASRAAPAGEIRTAEVARRNTDLLASIVAGISVPASELNVAPPVPTRTAAAPTTPERLGVAADRAVRMAEARKPEAKKPAPAKPEPKKPDPAKAEPARWFVQVAGGANAADLDKDWERLAAKSPAAFRGKSAWTTPLRATNRLLAGPFASQGAAMTFVNQLARDGSSAFAWRSEAGQKIEKLETQ